MYEMKSKQYSFVILEVFLYKQINYILLTKLFYIVLKYSYFFFFIIIWIPAVKRNVCNMCIDLKRRFKSIILYEYIYILLS